MRAALAHGRPLSPSRARLASVDFARKCGARALEGYPTITEPGREIMAVELHVGTRGMLAAAGFAEVSPPTPRRVVMRIDFRTGRSGAGDP